MPRRSELQPHCVRLRRWAAAATMAAAVCSSFTGLFAQVLPRTLAPAALEQLRLLGEWKAGRSVAERKIDSQLLFALDRRAGRLPSALARIQAAAVPSDGSRSGMSALVSSPAGPVIRTPFVPPPPRPVIGNLTAKLGRCEAYGKAADPDSGWTRPCSRSSSQGASRSMPISASKDCRGRTTAKRSPLTRTSAASGRVL